MEEAQAKDYPGKIIELLETKHVILKHEFASLRNERPCGMKKTLNKLNLPLDGIHHRGIDDAKNITQIFRAIYPDLNLKS